LSSFVDWLINCDLASWDALAALGQVIGAGATVRAVTVALKLPPTDRCKFKQTQLAIEQMEELKEKKRKQMKFH
jgi:hypothetical protein